MFIFWRLRQLISTESRGRDLILRFLEHDRVVIDRQLYSFPRLIINQAFICINSFTFSFFSTFRWWHEIRISYNCFTLLLDLFRCRLYLDSGQVGFLHLGSALDFGHKVNVPSDGVQRFVDVIVGYYHLFYLVHIIATSSYVSDG